MSGALSNGPVASVTGVDAPILIMAGGTGGHVFPGLAVAEALRAHDRTVVWLGTQRGLEARVVPPHGIDVEWISIVGVRGRGILAWAAAPFRAAGALVQALGALRRRRPAAVLGMGGFVAGPGGERRVPMADFFTGVRKTVLAPNELLVEIAVPAPGPRSGGNYLRHTPRRELDIAVVGVASQITLTDGVCTKARIALASVAPTPVRATAAEQALVGLPMTPDLIERAAALAVDAARPISDQRGSADYRRHLVRVLTRRTLATALERARHSSGGT